MSNDSLAAVKSIKDKEMRKILVTLVGEHGHRAVRTTSGHVRVLHADGAGQVLLSGTPSDYRSHKNALAQLRRAGFQI